MPSIKVSKEAEKIGLKVNEHYFDKYDCIETNDDFIALYDILKGFKDINGRHPCFTACTCVANPDFEKIEADKRHNYHYVPFYDSYNQYINCNRSFDLFKEGINQKIFYPQFHGREHINVKRWLNAVNSRSIKEEFCFKNKALLGTLIENDDHHNYFSSFDYIGAEEETEISKIIKDGLNLFQEIFGFKSVSFVSPTNKQGLKVNKIFADNQVLFCQTGGQYWRMPDGTLKKKDYFWGKKDSNGLTFWRRNCNFEPSRNNEDWVDKCLSEINIAFKWGKPAVISTHRVNFIGGIYEDNRTRSLKKLEVLLSAIAKKWPDVEYFNSAQLADIINTRI